MSEIVRSITQDEYTSWKESPVTQRFLAEIRQELDETRISNIGAYHPTVDQIALAYREKSVHCEVLEGVLDWIPVELQPKEE